MARTDNRLDLDANLVGYWGFDETLETDNAVDESSYADAHLTVTGSPSVPLGRIGAGRQLTGTAYASITHARLRLALDATLMGWFNLDTVNSGGSLLRTLISCSGPTTGDVQLFGAYVDSGGRLVYKHTSVSGEVIVRTAPGVIRTKRFFNAVVVRSAGGTHIQFVVDNFIVPVADITVAGGASTFPLPAPSTSSIAVFSIGRSQKESDSAYWDGTVDEVSVHNTARAYQPYLRGSYFRAALRSNTTHLSGTASVLNVSSSDMGVGVRWWCYERDKDIYVVKEAPFGSFGLETRLTSPGGERATTTTSPELVYDAATDTLYILFIAGNRVFKLSSNSTDDPATINMPFTADTGGILKILDNAEGVSIGEGGGMYPNNIDDIAYVNRTPIKIGLVDGPASVGEGGGNYAPVMLNTIPVPSAAFMSLPAPTGFSVAVGPVNGRQGGYRVFQRRGDGNLLLGSAAYSSGGFYYKAISPIIGDVFYAEALTLRGHPTGTFSNAVVYNGGLALLKGGTYYVGSEFDNADTMNGGEGGGMYPNNVDDITYVNRTPVKFSGADAPAYKLGEGGGQFGRTGSSGSNRPGGIAIEVELA